MTYSIITRAEWGARPPRQPLESMPPVSTVVIHHEAAPSRADHAQCDDQVRSVQAYHLNKKDENGKYIYRDIAYNFLVCQHGSIYEGRGWGKADGATQGWSGKSLSICALGNFQSEYPTPALIDAIRWWIARGLALGEIMWGYRVVGHRDLNATACPGTHLYAKLADIRKPYVAATKNAYQVHDPNGRFVGQYDTFDAAAAVVAQKISASRNMKYSIQRVVVEA